MLDNYRGIAVTSNVGKLFTRILANRLESDVEQRGLLGNIQYGFRKGKRSTDAVFILSQIIEQRRKAGKKLAVAFLDVRKAYDRVWREGLWETMSKWGYGGKVLNIVKRLYEGAETKYRFQGIESESIRLRVGLKQGCVLSPMLFSIYIMELGHLLEQSGLGVEVGEARIPGLFFADDIVLTGRDGEELQRLLNIVGQFGEERKLEFNPSKSKIMVNWREPTTTQRWDIQGVRVGEGNKYSVRVGECEEYKYLGVVMRLRGRIFKGMEVRRLENMRKQNNRVQGFCRNTLNKAFCARVAWERVVLPGVLYGMEVVVNSKGWLGEAEKEQSKMGRFITGGSKWCSVAGIQGEVGWESIWARITKARLMYAKRFDEGQDIWGQAVMAEAEKIKSKWWVQVCALADTCGMHMSKCRQMGENQWKKMVRVQVNRKEIAVWRGEVKVHKTLEWVKAKVKPKWEGYLNGSRGASALFKLRVGDWDMGAKRRHWVAEGGDMCRLCLQGKETLEHILGTCESIKARMKGGRLDIWGSGEVKLILGMEVGGSSKEWEWRRRMARDVLDILRNREGKA